VIDMIPLLVSLPPPRGERVTDVIVVAVREQHMRETLGGFLPPPFPGGVIRQKRIDQDLGRAHLDAKAEWPYHVSFIGIFSSVSTLMTRETSQVA
jgi:hypothetical protein